MHGSKDMKKFKKHQPYEITWVDIQSDDTAWVDNDEIQKQDVAVCKDVCYIYSKTDDKLIAYTSYSYDNDGNISRGGITAFPAGCIKEIKKL